MTGEVADVLEVRRGAYYDSVTLMLVSRDVLAVDGVSAAQVAMGTELNLDRLRGTGRRRTERPGRGGAGGGRRRRGPGSRGARAGPGRGLGWVGRRGRTG